MPWVIEIKNDAVFSAEVCEIRPGQRFKKRVRAADTTIFIQLLVFKPGDRLHSIKGARPNNVGCEHPIHIENSRRLMSLKIFN